MKDVSGLIPFVGMQQEEQKKIEGLLKEVISAPHGLLKISASDIRELFSGGGEIHAIDISMDGAEEKRMEQSIEQVKEKTKCLHAFSRALIYFFFPENHPLVMDELYHANEWMESIPNKFMIKWGMATQTSPEFRVIVLLQDTESCRSEV